MIHEPSTIVAEHGGSELMPPRLELDHWRAEYGVVAGITGASEGFDMALWGANHAGRVMSSWHLFQESFKPGFHQFVVGHQVHGSSVEVCEGVGHGLHVKEGLDGHATRQPGILLIVLVADCVPVYLLNQESKAVVLLHAGWRGTAAGVLEAGLTQLESFGKTNRSDVVMHCGVSICGNCYEVGPEVIEATSGRKVDRAENLDLRGVLAEQAGKLGIGRVTTSSWCAAHDEGRFHSHRSKGALAGRMAAYLGVPLA